MSNDEYPDKPDPVLDALYNLGAKAKVELTENDAISLENALVGDLLTENGNADAPSVEIWEDLVDITFPDGTKRHFMLIAHEYEVVEITPTQTLTFDEQRAQALRAIDLRKAQIKELLEMHKARTTS